MVFFYHIVSQYLVDAVPAITPLARSFLFDGPLAVLVFFVISGYALSAATVAGKEVDFRLAIVARYFRLAIPIGVVTFATLLLLKANLFFHQDVAMQGVGTRWMLPKYLFDPTVYGAVKFALYNVFFAYFPQSSYNVVLWTISIEFLGSLALFAYLSVFRRDGHVHWHVGFAAWMLLSVRFPYLACFMSGYLIAELRHCFHDLGNKNRFANLGCVFGFLAVATIASFLSFHDARIDQLLATALVAAVAFSPLLTWAFQARISRFLGWISFPFYLVHIPIIYSLSTYMFLSLPRSATYVAFNITATFAVSLAVATLLAPLEQQSVRLAKWLALEIVGFPNRNLPATKAGALFSSAADQLGERENQPNNEHESPAEERIERS